MTMMSTPISKAAAPSAKTDPAVQAAQAVPGGTSTAASASNAPSAAGAPFAQWLGQQAAAAGTQASGALAAALAALAQGADPAPTAAVASDATSPEGAKPAAEADDSTSTQDSPLLAAMAMPLMPLTPMQIAQAVQIAQGGATTGSAGTAGTDTAASGDGKADAAVTGVTAADQNKGRRADIPLPQAPLPARAQVQAQPRPDDGAVRMVVQAATQGGANAGGTGNDAGTQDGGAPAPATPALATALAASPTATASAPADTIKLAGPPTAWRQSLQEALGDRLHLQVGKNVEQAVIRLEPPQLGRIDIAIRHSNGTLEVNISATNGEVLRQLQNVSENLRSDLAQRQYTDVAVSVTPAPKSNGAAPFGDPQQQGRGRQQNRDQDEPGRALAEASKATSAFTLGGRDS